jgi:hypothetical protein
LLVYFFGLAGIMLCLYATVQQWKAFSGLDLKVSEVFSLVVSLTSAVLYVCLFYFYSTIKTSKFTIEDEEEMFEAIEQFTTTYCITSDGIQLWHLKKVHKLQSFLPLLSYLRHNPARGKGTPVEAMRSLLKQANCFFLKLVTLHKVLFDKHHTILGIATLV